MVTILTLLADLGLGFLAYRLAGENRARIESLETRLTNLETLWKVFLDVDRN